MVIEVLDLEIIYDNSKVVGHSQNGLGLVTEGHVQLDWQLYQTRSSSYGPTRFEVTKIMDPSFDALLGYEDSFANNLLREAG